MGFINECIVLALKAGLGGMFISFILIVFVLIISTISALINGFSNLKS